MDWKARYLSNEPLLVGDVMYARGVTTDYGVKLITDALFTVVDDYGNTVGWRTAK